MSLFYAQTSGGSPLPTKLNVKSSHWHSKSFTKVPINLSFLARLTCFQAQLQLHCSHDPYSFPPPCLPWLLLFLAHILSFHNYLSKVYIIPGHLKILSVSDCPFSNLIQKHIYNQVSFLLLFKPPKTHFYFIDEHYHCPLHLQNVCTCSNFPFHHTELLDHTVNRTPCRLPSIGIADLHGKAF